MSGAPHDLDVDAALARLEAELTSSAPSLVDEVVERTISRWGNFDEETRRTMVGPLRRATDANLLTWLAALGLPDAGRPEIPAEALEGARVTARGDFPLHQLLSLYHLGHHVVWSRCVAITGQLPMSAAVRTELLQSLSHSWWRYVDHVLSGVAEAYQLERERHLQRRSRRRSQLIQEALDGGQPSPDRLGYDLRWSHVGLVLSGPGADTALTTLADLAGRRLLPLEAVDGTTSVWIAASEPLDLRRGLESIDDLRVGVGSRQPGPAGFRLTHREARSAHAVAERTNQPFAGHGDTAVESIALLDEPAALRFVRRELSGLDAPGERDERLRETLATYLGKSQNAAASAAALGITDRTVTSRIRQCEELLGGPVGPRAAELQIALRWRALLGRDGGR